MYLIVVIIQDVKRIPDLLHGWQKIGVPGGTILHSAGFFQTASWLSRLGLGGLDRIFDSGIDSQRTLLVAVDNDELLEAVKAEADRVVGGFQYPNSGLLFVLPIHSALGMVKLKPRSITNELPAPLNPDWKVQRDTPISQIPPFLVLRPTVVTQETPLDVVAEMVMETPNNHVVCVVDDQARLTGLISIRKLADDLFFHIFPEEFLSELTDLEHLMDFAKMSSMRSAGDAMQEPVWIKENDSVKEAFKRMHENKLPGLPVINDAYQVTGYINLLSLLSQRVKDARREAAENKNIKDENSQ